MQKAEQSLGNLLNKKVNGFRVWGRNARVLVATEFFWSIPMSWIFFYRPIFLRESIGLSEVQIGLLLTVLTFFTTVSPLAGGYLADRFGRKRVFMSFDSLGWLSSMAVWTITRNMSYALAAYIMEGVAAVIYSVWECMLVEDTEPRFRASIYGTVSAAYSVGSLSMPIAGYLVGAYGVDLGCRILFASAFSSMVVMFAIRQASLRETELGYQIMKEKSLAGLKGYLSSLSIIRRNRIMAALLLTFVASSFYYSVAPYLSLYLIDERGLGLTEELASLMPAASSISALTLALLVVPNLTEKGHYIKALTIGYGLGFVAIVLLIHSGKGYLPSALVSGALLGIYQAMAFSVSRTLFTNEIEEIDSRARAKALSITITLSSLINLPAPTLAGYLFSLDPKLPFMVVSGGLVISLATLLLAVRRGS